MSTPDVIVAGLGGAGSAALFHLASRGARVLGLDPHAPPHDRGSTHGSTRVIRLAYFEHPDYVPLLRRSYVLWSELEALAGEQLYFERGVLQAGPPDGEVVPGVLASARLHGLEVEALSAAQARRRFPRFVIPDELEAVLEHRAGYLRVERCVEAHLAGARARGAAVSIGESLLSWREDGAGVEVTTDRGVHRAGALIIAGGAWAPQLLAEVGVRFELVKKTMLWYGAEPDEAWPVWLFETPLGVYYGLPPLPGEGAKVAEHSGGAPITDPASLDRSLDLPERERVERFLAKYLPSLEGPPIAHAPCMYTLTPDRNFILDRHPRSSRVVAIAGLSGHGFKLVPALGEAAAALALGGEAPLPIDLFSLSRPAL